MPKTDFEMRANLATKEELYLKRWEAADHFFKIISKRQHKEPFVLHDGPPYANGNLHSGSAMNRILKDIINRSHAMLGYYTPFVPGWDTHGLPIENAIIKQGINRKEMKPEDFRKLCYEYAVSQIEMQKSTMKRLGQMGDFSNPYITLSKEYEADQVRSFSKMALKGLIYQGLKPVYWSYASESALAESEIIYQDKKDQAIYVTFQVADGKGILDGSESFVIWTTTPWTLPANKAICLNPRFDYALVETNKGKLIVLENNVEKLMQDFEILEYQITRTFKGQELEYIEASHPFYQDKRSLVIVGDHVTAEEGTGCVHTAPGHGIDDFNVALKYQLEVVAPVDEKGHMTSEAGLELAGQFIEKANKTIIKMLEDNGHLLKKETIIHSYPYDERMKSPVIFRATVQWFASIEKIRDGLLMEIKKVNWLNNWGEVRLYNMIETRGDWCISRQRLWGLPIPIIYHEDGTPIIEEEVFNHIADLFDRYGSNVWYEYDVLDLLPAGYTHELSPHKKFTKEVDIMDVWFDSGSSFNVLFERLLKFPADLYFEGSDQYRGWFNSSLIISYATNGSSPYKNVLSHGYVLDEKGDKMSKSIGNIINPLDIVNVYGADVLRLWCANIDFRQDVRIGDAIMKQTSDQYRKIRNTFRFMLGNLNKNDFDPKTDYLNYDQLETVDKHIQILLQELNGKCLEFYKNFEYLKVSSALSIFMTNELSAYYFNIAKDILYIEKKNSIRRRQVQSVIYDLLNTLLLLWAPILVYTSEEIFDFIRNQEDSIHYHDFKESMVFEESALIKKDFEQLLLIRDDVLKALEDARENKLIGKPLEAKVVLNLQEADRVLLEKTVKNIPQWLTVSQVEFSEASLNKYKYCEIKIEKAEGEVCPRCWNITQSVHNDYLCKRCEKVLE